MKRFSEQFKKQSESIRMRASERDALREGIVSYMEYHPLPKEMQGSKVVRPQTEGILSEPFRVITFNKLYVRSFAGLFALVLIVSVPLVAEHALPGDVLYPVKIQFNEQLRSTLALSPYAKVEWETETLERRISEARLLASEGKLTPETETQVAQAVKDHADAAQQEIAQLRQSDSDGAAIAEIALSSALQVQSDVLAGNLQKDAQTNGQNQDGHSVAALAQVVAQARDSVQAAQSQSTTRLSYEKLLARIEQESTHAAELFESVKKEASSNEVDAVQRSLSDIQRKVNEAKAIKNGTASSSLDAGILSAPLPIDASTTSTSSSSDEVDTTATTTASATTTSSVGDDAQDTASTSASSSRVVSTSTNDAASSTVATSSNATPQAAIDLLRSALGDLQKVISYLTHIDVRQDISLQDLVPVTLTSDEQMAKINQLYSDSRSIQTAVINAQLSADIESKVGPGENQLESDLAKVASAVRKGDLATALSKANEAYAVALDLQKLIASDKVQSDQTVSDSVSMNSASTSQANDSTGNAE